MQFEHLCINAWIGPLSFTLRWAQQMISSMQPIHHSIARRSAKLRFEHSYICLMLSILFKLTIRGVQYIENVSFTVLFMRDYGVVWPWALGHLWNYSTCSLLLFSRHYGVGLLLRWPRMLYKSNSDKIWLVSLRGNSKRNALPWSWRLAEY